MMNTFWIGSKVRGLFNTHQHLPSLVRDVMELCNGSARAKQELVASRLGLSAFGCLLGA